MTTRQHSPTAARTDQLVAAVRNVSLPLRGDADLDPLIERIGDARYVLLGEASHGTSEYYTWRARLSRRLIEEQGFNFIAVEGDWPDCYCLNRYIKGYEECGDSARAVLSGFERWPTWMWANWEIVALGEWLRRRNDRLSVAERTGFYGLDVYSLWDSLRAVLAYLERVDPDAAFHARRAYRCFEQYGEDAQAYARATVFSPESCQREVVAMLSELRAHAPAYERDGRDAYFSAEQNALVARHAEEYYRAMISGGNVTWNLRDRHMMETLDRLMRHHGPEAKAIVWEHNTHIGDARATDMAAGGMVNVGQLAREAHAAVGVVLVGFGSHRGSVIAGSAWDAPMERMPVPAGQAGSWEDVLHRANAADQLLLLDGVQRDPLFRETRDHRAIGVVYEPMYERYGNYVPTVLPDRYDAFLFIDASTALHPLKLTPHDRGEPPETYPWGV